MCIVNEQVPYITDLCYCLVGVLTYLARGGGLLTCLQKKYRKLSVKGES